MKKSDLSLPGITAHEATGIIEYSTDAWFSLNQAPINKLEKWISDFQSTTTAPICLKTVTANIPYNPAGDSFENYYRYICLPSDEGTSFIKTDHLLLEPLLRRMLQFYSFIFKGDDRIVPDAEGSFTDDCLILRGEINLKMVDSFFDPIQFWLERHLAYKKPDIFTIKFINYYSNYCYEIKILALLHDYSITHPCNVGVIYYYEGEQPAEYDLELEKQYEHWLRNPPLRPRINRHKKWDRIQANLMSLDIFTRCKAVLENMVAIFLGGYEYEIYVKQTKPQIQTVLPKSKRIRFEYRSHNP